MQFLYSTYVTICENCNFTFIKEKIICNYTRSIFFAMSIEQNYHRSIYWYSIFITK